MSKKVVGEGGDGGGSSSSSSTGLGWKGRRKISLPWFRQGSLSKEEGSVVTPTSRLPPLLRQKTIDSPRSLQERLQPSFQTNLNVQAVGSNSSWMVILPPRCLALPQMSCPSPRCLIPPQMFCPTPGVLPHPWMSSPTQGVLSLSQAPRHVTKGPLSAIII